VAPVLPPAYVPLRVEGVALGNGRVDLEVTGDRAVIEGLPSVVEVLREPFRPDAR
jgi:hypothetical protein